MIKINSTMFLQIIRNFLRFGIPEVLTKSISVSQAPEESFTHSSHRLSQMPEPTENLPEPHEHRAGTRLFGKQRHVPLSRRTLQALFLHHYQPADPLRLLWSRVIDTMSRLQRAQMAWNWDLVGELYDPFDPDGIEYGNLGTVQAEDQAGRQEIFIRQFEEATRRANFQKVEFDTVEHAVRTKNDQRLQYEPNFQVFEEIRVYGCGQCLVERPKRSWRKGFQFEMKQHSGWHWLIVMVKFREGLELGPLIRANRIYLRLFKDVAFRELEMHLPEQATRLKMPLMDRFKIASPVFLGVPTVVLKIAMAASWLNPLVLGAVLTGSVSTGWKSFAGFRNAKLKHTHQMISNLFYLTLANNRQCVTRVMEMACEQESLESLLALRILWEASSQGERLDAEMLDQRVEQFLRNNGDLDVDFQNLDAIDKLQRLGLLKRDGVYLELLPLEECLEIMRAKWHQLMP